MKIGIPVLNRGDLLARLLRSIDVEARVLIVVNRIGPVDASVEAMVRESEREPLERLQIEVRWIEGNLGVAGSWNRILDEFGGDCWISNSDIAFGPGVLTEAMGQIEAHRSIVLHHLWAAACFYATAEFTRRLGWFDENFYPAYREDQEMALRSAALAVPRRIFAGIDPKRIVHGGSETIKSADERARRYHPARAPTERAVFRRALGPRAGEWRPAGKETSF